MLSIASHSHLLVFSPTLHLQTSMRLSHRGLCHDIIANMQQTLGGLDSMAMKGSVPHNPRAP